MGWFTPSCPVTTYEKAWVESRMGWLADKLGIERLLKARVVLPTAEFFPESYSGDRKDVYPIFNRLCERMLIDPRSVQLRIMADDEMPEAAGQYHRHDRREQATIWIAESQLKRQEVAIAIVAHELAHEILLGGKLLEQGEKDHEWVTDLLPVFLGLGVFATNSSVLESHVREGNEYWWTIGKLGYLPMRVFAYALACFASIREESRPEWSRHLRLDASKLLAQGMKFIRKTGDCRFTLDRCRNRPAWSLTDALEGVKSGTPSVRLASLWEIRERGTRTPLILPDLIEALQDADADVVVEAVELVGSYGPPAIAAYPLFVDLLQADRGDVRAAAATALSNVTETRRATAIELSNWLTDESREVVFAVADAIVRLGERLDIDSVERILKRLEPATHGADDQMIDALLEALKAASDDPRRDVANYFTEVEDDCRDELNLRLSGVDSPDRETIIASIRDANRPNDEQKD